MGDYLSVSGCSPNTRRMADLVMIHGPLSVLRQSRPVYNRPCRMAWRIVEVLMFQRVAASLMERTAASIVSRVSVIVRVGFILHRASASSSVRWMYGILASFLPARLWPRWDGLLFFVISS